jgi:hypothetical protein
VLKTELFMKSYEITKCRRAANFGGSMALLGGITFDCTYQIQPGLHTIDRQSYAINDYPHQSF